MTPAHPLDAVIGETLPSLRTAASSPRSRRRPMPSASAASTYEALKIGAARDPEAAAIRFLQERRSRRDAAHGLACRVHRPGHAGGELFHSLGVGPGDVVSLLMPLLPQTFFALFGAQAAGIANPVNPLLSATQIAEILRAAGTKVLVTLGPVPGSDIQAKVQQHPRTAAGAEGGPRRARRRRRGDPAVHDFDAMLDRHPPIG